MFCDTQIVIITNFVIVSSVSIKRVLIHVLWTNKNITKPFLDIILLIKDFYNNKLFLMATYLGKMLSL